MTSTDGSVMHIPDGTISGSAAIASGVVALGAVSASLVVGARRLRERQIPLIGIVAAVLLTAQTIHIPLGPGVNGHLIGGALAAILLGPWLACLVVAAALLLDMSIGHGGVTTLGANILVNGLVPGIGGYCLFRALVAVLPRTRRGFLTATAITSWATVVIASVIASLLIAHASALGELAILPAVFIGLHAVIGIVEAVVTTAAVGAVMTMRPDLMATRDLLPPTLTPSGAGV